MKLSKLIMIDKLFSPLYKLMQGIKTIGSRPKEKQDEFLIIKFFGLGSLTRIVYVSENLGISKDKMTLITLYRNKEIVELLGVNAIYIDLKNVFTILRSGISAVFKAWRKKNICVLDMERSSNLSGIFRIVISIGKTSNFFSFEPFNHKTKNEYIVSLLNKPALKAIAEMFGEKKENKKEISSIQKAHSGKIMININAGDYLGERKFPMDKYAELVKAFHVRFPKQQFILTGGKSEMDRVRDFTEKLSQKGIDSSHILNMAGKYSLNEFVEELKEVDLLITNDSGPMHLSNYYGVKTVSIWGPTSPYLVGYPNNEKMLNLKSKEECQPCFLNPKSSVAEFCKGELTCFKTMEINAMVDEIETFLNLKETLIEKL